MWHVTVDLFTPRILNPLPVGPGGPHSGSHLYVNQGDGTFVENSDAVFSENIIWVNGASWVDFDSDADLDLVCSAQAGGFVGTRVYRNDNGAFNYASLDLGLGELGETVGVTPLDLDLDGMVDLLTIPLDETLTPRLHINTGLAGSPYFVDFGSALGLEAGSTSGQVVNDFNGDGDLDLFLGRPVAGGKFFYQNAQDATTDAPANHWAAVEFAGDISCLDNRASIGATVTMKLDGIPRLVQVVDGGSSRGSQQPLRLTFGLGQDASSSIQFEVTWPSGVTATVNGTRDGVTLIGGAERGESVPIPIAGSVTAFYTPAPGGTADLTFQWVTPTHYECGLDLVEISSPAGAPPQCWVPTQTWTSLSSGVQSTVVLQADGTHLHTFVIEDRDCTPKCSYLYKVISPFNATTDGESPLRTLSTPYCVQ